MWKSHFFFSQAELKSRVVAWLLVTALPWVQTEPPADHPNTLLVRDPEAREGLYFPGPVPCGNFIEPLERYSGTCLALACVRSGPG